MKNDRRFSLLLKTEGRGVDAENRRLCQRSTFGSILIFVMVLKALLPHTTRSQVTVACAFIFPGMQPTFVPGYRTYRTDLHIVRDWPTLLEHRAD